MMQLYPLCDGETLVELPFLIEHPQLFSKYEALKYVRVRFLDGKENSGQIELPKVITSSEIGISENSNSLITRFAVSSNNSL